jgi:succinoglycan biosynthesis protein ExoA
MASLINHFVATGEGRVLMPVSPDSSAPRRPQSGGPLVSVVVPMLNEARQIERCLRSILGGTLPQKDYEILVLDGGSSDNSREIVESLAAQYPCIRVLSNPRRIQSAAMNLGVRNARGDYIIRMDAHSDYPPDYITNSIAELERTGAWNVGGTWEVTAGGNTVMARAMALLAQHPLGVGNAAYRLGGHGYVDTIPFGAFRRDLFDRIGGFREDLAAHEDFELNARIRRAGGAVYLSPAIHSSYFHVPSLPAFLRKAWSYGYWCARSWLMYPYCFAVRHFVPLAFVVALLASVAFAVVCRGGQIALAVLVMTYAVLTLGASVQLGLCAGAIFIPILPVLLFLRHVSYGVGSLAGIKGHFVHRIHHR